MKVGDYIRTEDGVLGKLRGYNAFNKNECAIIVKTINYIDYTKTIETEVIIKSSPNIIDLIEVGDYVDGQEVRYIEIGDDYRYLAIDEDYTYIIAGYDSDGYTKPIKSIVTHEQFKSMEYEVK